MDIGKNAYEVRKTEAQETQVRNGWPKIESCQDVPTDRDPTSRVGQVSREINVVNLNKIDPEKESYTPDNVNDRIEVPKYVNNELNMQEEQTKDSKIVKIMQQLRNDEQASALQKYIMINDLLYYLSAREEEPILRLYIPQALNNNLLTTNLYNPETGL